MIFEVFKVDTYSDGSIESQNVGTTDTFEITDQYPVADGFKIVADQLQGTDSIVVSTRRGNSGDHFGSFYIRFSYGNIIASNQIDLYQY